MIDHDALNSDTPPDTLDSIDVDFLGLTQGGGLMGDPGYSTGIMRFDYQRKDGTTLTFHRWTDADGERFYSDAALRTRPSFQEHFA